MRLILPIIVIAQFFCTSLWFAGNSIISDIARDFNLDHNFLAHLTSAIQFGFITGTLVFAVLTISDRFSPSKVFFLSSILAGLFKLTQKTVSTLHQKKLPSILAPKTSKQRAKA